MLGVVAVMIKIIHFIVCIGLIVVVLLQADKGEGLAGAFGGGASGTVFGNRGDGGVIAKATSTMAVIFMITSLVISIWLPRWANVETTGRQTKQVQTSGSTKSGGEPLIPLTGEAPVVPVQPGSGK